MNYLKVWLLNKRLNKSLRENQLTEDVRHKIYINGYSRLEFSGPKVEDEDQLADLLEEVVCMLRAPKLPPEPLD